MYISTHINHEMRAANNASYQTSNMRQKNVGNLFTCSTKGKKLIITSTAAIRARIRPVPVSIEPKRESPILHEINCAPGATPFNKGS